MPAVVSFRCLSPFANAFFRHQVRPGQSELNWLQDSNKTASGIPVVQLPYAKTRVMSVTFNNMPKPDKDGLLNFFNVINGMATEFSVLLSDNTWLTNVRFAEPSLSFTEKSTDVFSITIKLVVITP